MRKNKLTAILLVVVIVCLCATLFACNKDEGGGNDGDFIKSVTTIPAPDDGIKDVEYKVTVLYPDLSPVVGAEVQLFYIEDDEEPFCGATTGSDGVAVLLASEGLEYYVILKSLPEGYIYEDEEVLLDDEITKTVIIESELSDNKYDVKVVSEGGMPMSGVTISLKDGDSIIASKVTGENGSVGVKVGTLGNYSVELSGLPTGYTVMTENPKTTENGGEVTIVVKSEVIKEAMPQGFTYSMDDIMYDFTVTTSDGATFTLSEVLKEKKFVMINFWATWCTSCKAEFDDIQEAYERYQDDVAVIAISTSDTMVKVANFKSSYTPTLTFDMSIDDDALYDRFIRYSQGNIPLSIFVDRYGKICNYIMGGGTEALFKQEFARYTATDYVQVAYDPNNDEIPENAGDVPDVEMPASDEIVNKISPSVGGTYSEYGDGKVWPWLLGKDGNDDILYAGNIGHNTTESILYYTFKINAGEFLTFDYFMNTEDIGNADIMSVYIDGSWVCELERISGGWKTMHLYTPLSTDIDAEDEQREHLLTLHYVKDSSDGVYLDGEEMVAIKNIRKVPVADLKGDVNVLRDASWNYQEVDGVSQYTNFATVVYNSTDGYYHVGSEDGPHLLANICGSTHYNDTSVAELAANGYFELAGIQAQISFISDGISNPPADSYVEYHKGYAWIAGNSDLPNYCYVDKRLKIVLDIMAKAFASTKVDGQYLGSYYNANTWLEFCSYSENYAGNDIGNILEGICNKEAIVALGNDTANHVVVDKTLVPRGIIHKFVPSVDGAYRVYSIIPEEYASQQGGYVYIMGSDFTKSEDAIDDFDQYVTLEAGETYYIGVAFDLPSSWGELDFYIQYIGASADHFTPVTDGTYTYIIDEDDNIETDDNGQTVFVVNKYDSNFSAQLGADNYYHQTLADGTLDTGDTSYIWIALAQENVLIDATLESLANGTQSIDGLDDIGFFDFTDEGGEDYTEYILELCAESRNQDSKAKTWGMVKADAKLVGIIKKALARIDHDSDESWLGLAFYYEHLGEYPATNK